MRNGGFRLWDIWSGPLGDNEHVVYRAHFHWSYWLRAWAVLIVLGILIVGIVIFIHMWAFAGTTEFAVTNHRIVKKTGLFRRNTEEIGLGNVEEVHLHQGFWGRLLGFGSLTIHGSGQDFIQSPRIADPLAFRKAMEDAIN